MRTRVALRSVLVTGLFGASLVATIASEPPLPLTLHQAVTSSFALDAQHSAQWGADLAGHVSPPVDRSAVTLSVVLHGTTSNALAGESSEALLPVGLHVVLRGHVDAPDAPEVTTDFVFDAASDPSFLRNLTLELPLPVCATLPCDFTQGYVVAIDRLDTLPDAMTVDAHVDADFSYSDSVTEPPKGDTLTLTARAQTIVDVTSGEGEGEGE